MLFRKCYIVVLLISPQFIVCICFLLFIWRKIIKKKKRLDIVFTVSKPKEILGKINNFNKINRNKLKI